MLGTIYFKGTLGLFSNKLPWKFILCKCFSIFDENSKEKVTNDQYQWIHAFLYGCIMHNNTCWMSVIYSWDFWRSSKESLFMLLYTLDHREIWGEFLCPVRMLCSSVKRAHFPISFPVCTCHGKLSPKSFSHILSFPVPLIDLIGYFYCGYVILK